LRPLAALRVVTAEIARIPFRDPHVALRVGPYAARALALGGRLDARRAAVGIDPADERSGQRGVVDRSIRRVVDAVGPAAVRRLEDLHLAGARIEAAVDAALAGEPVHALAVE